MPKTVPSRVSRTKGTMARSRTRKKPKCAICLRMMAIFRDCDATRYRGFRLGSLQEVMQSTQCLIHPAVVRAGLPEQLDKDIYEVFVVTSGRVVHILTRNKTSGNLHEGMALALMKNEALQNGWRIGIAIDPRWIQPRLLRRWRLHCDAQQKKGCHHALTGDRLSGTHPAWLIDTWRLCLVPGMHSMPYVTLSYMWGKDPFFLTTLDTLIALQKPQALSMGNWPAKIPRTVVDAISLTPLLGERYLWIDSLCIVQDDENMKRNQIKNMGYIFANASLTIIAQQGEDANYGLRGLRGISEPRHTSQNIVRMSKTCKLLQTESRFWRLGSTWETRGWTFQEEKFSRRTLSFSNDRVWWRCACSFFTEDLEADPGYKQYVYGFDMHRSVISSNVPDLDGYEGLVSSYNRRELTNPEDAPAAFEGILTTLNHSFRNGFLYGLPILFFDLALCWQPQGRCTRRRPRLDTSATRARLPSWSWMGWKTSLSHKPWRNSFVKGGRHNTNKFITSQQFITNAKWYSQASLKSERQYIDGTQTLYNWWSAAQISDSVLPPGWHRLAYSMSEGMRDDPELSRFPGEHPPEYIFKHESEPDGEFWQPIPTAYDATMLTGSSPIQHNLLYCRTQKVVLNFGDRFEAEGPNTSPWHINYDFIYSLKDPHGKWVGIVQMNTKPDDNADDPQICHNPNDPLELVIISEAYTIEGRNEEQIFPEWKMSQRPKGPNGTKYEYYNVLLVVWEDGIAYRQGCGRVIKSAWEALYPETIDLTLG